MPPLFMEHFIAHAAGHYNPEPTAPFIAAFWKVQHLLGLLRTA
jgi:hypothetical protein